MKFFKITLLVTLFFASITSCTEQDLNEDDIQVETAYFTGGEANEEPVDRD